METGELTELNSKIMAYLNEHDVFCRENGIRLTRVAAGEARAELQVAPHLLNASGVVQGGAIFTLADFSFAGAANCDAVPGERMVMMSSSITVVRPGTGKRLIARTQTLSRGRRTGLFETRIFDEAERLVAVVTTNGFLTHTAEA